MSTMTIGQVAKQAAIGVETVRFYERQGLLEPPPRRASGYREYTREAVDRLRFIRRAKELGFTLAEIKDLLQLHVDPGCSCADVRTRAMAKIMNIEGRIRTLQRMKRVLTKLVSDCDGESPTSACPILKALEK
jgi:Hg(II)-responsive transcriptional regulator